MQQKTYRRLLFAIILLGSLSTLALVVYTVVAYRNASILNFIAAESW